MHINRFGELKDSEEARRVKRVVCVNDELDELITIGKEYDVVECEDVDWFYTLTDDRGNETDHDKERFDDI